MVSYKVNRETVYPFIEEYVAEGSMVYNDEFRLYADISALGYTHDNVNHSSDEFARGEVHTNTIEGFWSYHKNDIRGAYKHASDKYLQLQMNEYLFICNYRKIKLVFFGIF